MNKFPSIDSLEVKAKDFLRSAVKLTKTEVRDEFYDDHALCFDVRFTAAQEDGTERQFEISIWWTGPSFLAAFEYATETDRAQKEALKELKNRLQDA